MGQVGLNSLVNIVIEDSEGNETGTIENNRLDVIYYKINIEELIKLFGEESAKLHIMKQLIHEKEHLKQQSYFKNCTLKRNASNPAFNTFIESTAEHDALSNKTIFKNAQLTNLLNKEYNSALYLNLFNNPLLLSISSFDYGFFPVTSVPIRDFYKTGYYDSKFAMDVLPNHIEFLKYYNNQSFDRSGIDLFKQKISNENFLQSYIDFLKSQGNSIYYYLNKLTTFRKSNLSSNYPLLNQMTSQFTFLNWSIPREQLLSMAINDGWLTKGSIDNGISFSSNPLSNKLVLIETPEKVGEFRTDIFPFILRSKNNSAIDFTPSENYFESFNLEISSLSFESECLGTHFADKRCLFYDERTLKQKNYSILISPNKIPNNKLLEFVAINPTPNTISFNTSELKYEPACVMVKNFKMEYKKTTDDNPAIHKFITPITCKKNGDPADSCVIKFVYSAWGCKEKTNLQDSFAYSKTNIITVNNKKDCFPMITEKATDGKTYIKPNDFDYDTDLKINNGFILLCQTGRDDIDSQNIFDFEYTLQDSVEDDKVTF